MAKNKKSVKKEKIERKDKKHKISWIGIFAGLLAIVAFISIFLCMPNCNFNPSESFLHFLLIFGYSCFALSILLCLTDIIRGNRKSLWILLFIVLCITSSLFLYSIVSRFMILCPGDAECSQIKLTLVKANSLDNTLEVRRNAGGADVSVTSVKITYIPVGTNKEKAATITNPPKGKQSISEQETITYTIAEDIKAGDTIYIAAIVLYDNGKKEHICNIASSIKAI